MNKYNIYVGLGESFGGTKYYGTLECNNKEEAELYAYDIAKEEYEEYSECYGLRTYDDCFSDYCEVNDIEDPTEDDYDNIEENYNDEVEGYIDYYVLSYEDDPIEEDKYIELN